MKNVKRNRKIRIGLGVALAVMGAEARAELSSGAIGDSLEGVWAVTRFEQADAQGRIRPWCEGAYGSILYLRGMMFVAINCRSEPEKKVIYSGRYRIEGDTVAHAVQNAFDESLIGKVLSRRARMTDPNHLRLEGAFGNGGRVRLSFVRRRGVTQRDSTLPGVYRLIRSENDFEGRSGVPYCTGVHGAIFYTPDGYAAVALNCGRKSDPNRAEPADVHGRKYFYFGRYELGRGTIRHQLENASLPEQIGERVERRMRRRGDVLSLAGTNGSAFVAIWKKLDARQVH